MSDYYWEYKIVNTKNTHTNKTAWEREGESQTGKNAADDKTRELWMRKHSFNYWHT